MVAMTRDTQHALELLRPASDVDYCTWYECGRRSHVVVDGRAFCVSHGTSEFIGFLENYIPPRSVAPSDARF